MSRPINTLLGILLLIIGTLGFASAWILFSTGFDRLLSWMAVLAAADAALLVRLARLRPGWARALVGLACTTVAIAFAHWGIAAAQIGKLMGLLPWESAMLIGNEFAWLLIKLANGPVDIAWAAAGLAAALFASR